MVGADPRKGEAMNIERFINDQNLERFRKLASGKTGVAERAQLLTLLADEQAKFIELQRCRPTGNGEQEGRS